MLMQTIQVLIFLYFFIVLIVSQLNHNAIKALQAYPDDYLSAGKPEPGWTIGLGNLKYTQYLLAGNFTRIEDSQSVRKLKAARYGVILSVLYFVSLVFWLLLLN